MASNRGYRSELQGAFERAVAAATVNQEWRPPFRAAGEKAPITIHTQELVTVLPCKEWADLVFAIHGHLKEPGV